MGDRKLVGSRDGQDHRQDKWQPMHSDEIKSADGLKYRGISDNLDDSFSSIRRAKKEWEMAVDALPELICVVDNQGYLVRANLTVERWSLGSIVSVAGRQFHDVIHHSCDPACYMTEFLESAIERAQFDEPVEKEIYDAVLRRHVLIRASPIHDHDHEESAGRNLAIIIHDITSRKEMESALQQNNNRLKVLNAVSGAILSAQSPEEIAQIVLQHIETLVPFQQAYILLNEPGKRQFAVLAAAGGEGLEVITSSSFRFSAFGDKINRCTDELYLIGDLHSSGGLADFEEQLRDGGSGAYINVPLQGESQPLGMFVVGMESIDAFKASQIQVIRDVSEMLTVAIRQAQLHLKYRHADSELQYLWQRKEQLAEGERHPPRAALPSMREQSDLMKDEFFSLLIEDSPDKPVSSDNWDDMLG
jgi:PAS domain-containing protein